MVENLIGKLSQQIAGLSSRIDEIEQNFKQKFESIERRLPKDILTENAE